jgi:hypothetical protein
VPWPTLPLLTCPTIQAGDARGRQLPQLPQREAVRRLGKSAHRKGSESSSANLHCVETELTAPVALLLPRRPPPPRPGSPPRPPRPPPPPPQPLDVRLTTALVVAPDSVGSKSQAASIAEELKAVLDSVRGAGAGAWVGHLLVGGPTLWTLAARLVGG